MLRMGVGVLEPKGVGKRIWGGEIVIWGCTGSVWDEEAAHGVSAARDDDGVWMGRGGGLVLDTWEEMELARRSRRADLVGPTEGPRDRERER